MASFKYAAAALVLAMHAPAAAVAADEVRRAPPYYAAGARPADGAVAFDMATLKRSGERRSIRVWQFSPVPVWTSDGFKAGSVDTMEFDCSGPRVRFRDAGVFAALNAVEPVTNGADQWLEFAAPEGEPDSSLVTTAWTLLCRDRVPPTWVAYDQLDLLALDYWSSLTPERPEGSDPHAVMKPDWAGPNARDSTAPKPPIPIVPW